MKKKIDKTEMENIYYVYSHVSIKDGKCFYIGIGKNDRVFAQGEHRNKRWKNKVWTDGGYSFIILVNGITKKRALELEKLFIKEIGLDNLTNIVGESGNSTAFKKNQTPWNKGLTGAQSSSYKKVKHNGIVYDSVKELREYLSIGNTTLYRRVKNGTLIIEYLEKD